MKLSTWAGKSSFNYTGSVATGTEITFGEERKVTVTKKQYADLRKHFLKRIVAVGTSKTDIPKDSIGEWLKDNVKGAAITSYVAAILVSEEYAERIEKHHIRVVR